MSFRIRLFASIVVTVLVVLATVMSVAWSRVLDVEMSRLNDGLCSEASRVALERFSGEALAGLEVDIMRKLRIGESRDVLVRYEDRTNTVAFQSQQWSSAVPSGLNSWQVRTVQAPPQPNNGMLRPQCELASFLWGGTVWQIARFPGEKSVGWVAANLAAPSQEIREKLLDGIRIVALMAVFLSGLAAWLLSMYLVRPVYRLRDSMKAVMPTDLGTRLKFSGEDREFTELIGSYNTMLARLERSFYQASRFSADAAHELKTPLTVLMGSIERLRRRAKDPQLHEELSALMDEVSRLASVTRKLLLLSQADAGKLELHLAEVNLSALLNDLMADVLVAGESKTVRADVADHLQVCGDAVLLRQLFNNLIGNALRYTDMQGLVEVKARRVGTGAEVAVFNTCTALSAQNRARFFQRFYRGEDVQSRGLEGSGLGLSLAREIARAHLGTVHLMPSAATEVLLVVSLPAV